MTQTTPAASSTPTTTSSLPLPDVFSTTLVAMFNEVQPSIVQVYTQGRGGGTGIIWHKDGRLITNNHVVPRDDMKVQVLLADGRTLEAKVLDRNPRLDLALLKVKGDNLKALPAADSAKLRVGEWVFAVGHPWGQRWVITAGIVSSKRSVKLADDLTTEYIQSDVRLAPGNSGGPLLDADGKVVGINAMIFGGDLSVAIPSNVVSTWLAELPQRGITLGIEIQTVELPANIRQTLKSGQASGVLVVRIRPERQANHNDLFIGDILLDVAGTPVPDNATLLRVLAQSEERETIPMRVLRGGEVIAMDIATQALEEV